MRLPFPLTVDVRRRCYLGVAVVLGAGLVLGVDGGHRPGPITRWLA